MYNSHTLPLFFLAPNSKKVDIKNVIENKVNLHCYCKKGPPEVHNIVTLQWAWKLKETNSKL